MDVGFYLGELLMQVGEVSVPGLGYFVQARMSGHYDEQEGKFYPPYHQVQFDLQSIDDDALAQYIADKKNISLASARYFAEKYITSLKQQALIGEVAIGNLGWFYTDQAQLTFRPSDKLVDDSIFYGYHPIKLSKATVAPEPEQERPVISNLELVYPTRYPKPEPVPEVEPEPEYETPAVTNEDETEEDDENQVGYDEEFLDIDEEEETRSPLRGVIITLTILLVLAVGLFALYTYAPATFERLQFWKHKAVVVPLPVKKDTIATTNIDTLNTDSATKALNDTTAKATAPVDTLANSRYEVIVANCKNIAEANKAIIAFKKLGVDAKIVTDAPGQRIKLTAGTYKTKKEAEDAATLLLDTKKLKATDTYPQKIETVQQ